MGGGNLAGQFADAQLLDDVWVQYAPVTLGAGQPFLPRNLQLDLIELARNRDFACAHFKVRSAPNPQDSVRIYHCVVPENSILPVERSVSRQRRREKREYCQL